MNRKLEVAVTAWRTEKAWHSDALCQQVERAEAMGFHSYWLPENHFGDERAIPSPLTLLAAAAARTRTIGLATTSYLLPIRHPIQAAEEVAVLDQLCGGRLILGLGRGVQASVFDVFEVPTKEKRSRFQKNLEIMINAWRGEPLVTGQDGPPVYLAPLPLQRPHPPLWVAAFGPLALQQVGRLGLPYIGSPIEALEDLAVNYRLHREAAKESGQQLQAVVPLMRTILITDNGALASRLKERLVSTVPRQFQASGVTVDDWAIVGDKHYATDKLEEYVERLGVTHLIGGGRLPPVEEGEQLRSHEQLVQVGAMLNHRE